MNHAVKASKFIEDIERTKWHNDALWFLRQKRDRISDTIPEWEDLREKASLIKDHVISNLDEYLIEFENNAIRNGIKVHWAIDGEEHNRTVYDILKNHNVTKVVKSKSMLTEECHLNPFLEEKGIEVVDTDLGERIIQFRNEPPSHIVVPAIHLKKEEIGELFEEKLNTEKGNSDPQYLTEEARQHLREKFLEAEAGITGVNFAVASEGGVVVCTNEGNADLGTNLPPIHIACMGLEKIVPGKEELAVFLRLLARSATGQPITTYTSHFFGPRKDGEMHIIIVDNGRSKILGEEDFKKSLACIRCGACINTCPIYRRSGGHSYGYVIPGPIGSVLAPHYNMKKHQSLPFASTLCGSCTNVCPVKIDLHHQLLKWREVLTQQGFIKPSKKLMMKLMGIALNSSTLYGIAAFFAKSLRWMPRFMIYHSLNKWGNQREIPEPAKESFKTAFKKHKKSK
ncbi:MAG: iron-sulfur cluster-binding protein [Planctomycetota bacterium]|nr:MAG: iron-sulfur cluster-binding protein [Planctomycetota bacterium]